MNRSGRAHGDRRMDVRPRPHDSVCVLEPMLSIRVVRGLVVAMCACLLATVAVPVASAKPPTLKQAFAPLNQRIKGIGTDVSSALVATSKETDAQAADRFAGLARREAAVTIAVGRLAGARGSNLNAQ